MAEEKNILIVDDDIELGDLLAEAVSDMSDAYHVRVARDVDEAMVQVRKSQTQNNPFDLVITDIKMSGLSGLELLEAMYTIAPDTKTIAMTAYNSSDIAERAKELNVQAYLTKPFLISEFRQIVRSSLAPLEVIQVETLEEGTVAPSRVQAQVQIQVPADIKTSLTRELASLRTMTGAAMTILMHKGGSVVAVDSPESESDMVNLCATLVTAQSAVIQQMGQTFDQRLQFRQSYFGTASLSLCAYRLNKDFTTAVIFGPTVKEGQVWYYLRDVSDTLSDLLADVKLETPPPAPTAQAPQAQPISQPQPPKTAERTKTQAPPPPAEPTREIDLSSLDEINWDETPDMDWNTVVQDTDQGMDGLSFAEAQQQGLLSEELAEQPPAESVPDIDRPALDDLDWNVSPESDWETIVQETDQGMDGLSFEEAQKRGLVNDVGQE
jgi:CheY-like chemotaxis protein